MSPIKNYMLFFAVLISTLTFAQTTSQIDTEEQVKAIKSHIANAKKLANIDDFPNAKEFLNKANDLATQINDSTHLGIINTEAAKIEYYIENYDDALTYLTKAANIQGKSNDNANLALTYNIRGYIHTRLKQYDEALKYIELSKELTKDFSSEKYLPEILINEASVYYNQQKYTKAQPLLDEAGRLAKKYDLYRLESNAFIQRAKISAELENNSLALIDAKEGLKIAKENQHLPLIIKAYETLSNIYESTENHKEANFYIRESIKLSDSILGMKKAEALSQNKGQFNSINDIADKDNLQEQNSEATAESNLARITTILSISLITILSLLTLSLYKNNNIRLRTNNMLHKKNDELIVAKEKAELASKTKANFLSTVTHELRTPLYAVTGLTNMLLDEGPKESQIPHLKSLKFSGDYLLTFINDILQINKIEANKVELDPEQFNLKIKIENVISALNNSALDNGIKIHYDYSKELPETYVGDQLKISQILINLLGNAIKFTKDGDIWVRVAKVSQKKKEYRLRFEIEDNGIGISQEKQDNMFESFSQGSIQINRKYGGTGLGLSIVKGLIQILKGNISLKSELGKGTTFFFEIPLTYDEPKKVVPKVSEHSKNIKKLDLDNIKILVVEDNKINQMITKKILNKMGLFCEVVDNGEAAVEKVKNTEYGVVLMDIHMPGISGLEATKRIRAFNKTLTIFALTAVTLEDKMHEFDEAGFDDIISKPFKQEDFEKKLYHALAGGEKMTTNI